MNKQKISSYVKSDVIKSNLSQTDYCKSKGISRTLLFEIIKGKHDSPSATTAARMCEWFNLEPNKLFEMINGADDSFKKAVYTKIKNDPKIELKKCEIAIKKYVNFFDENSIGFNGRYFEEGELMFLSDLHLTINNQPEIADGICNLNTITLKEKHNYKNDDGKLVKYFTPDKDSITTKKLYLYYIPSRDTILKKYDIYNDYNFRAFVKPFIDLLSKNNNGNNCHANNIFITRTKEQYDNILKIFKDIKITSTNTNKIGIGIVFFNDIYDLDCTPIVCNDVINRDFFGV